MRMSRSSCPAIAGLWCAEVGSTLHSRTLSGMCAEPGMRPSRERRSPSRVSTSVAPSRIAAATSAGVNRCSRPCASARTSAILRRLIEQSCHPLSAESSSDGRLGMNSDFFTEVSRRIGYGGPESSDPLAYAAYEPDRQVLGKRMEDHLRIAVCLWHSFNWPGSDVFGVGTFDRPWLAVGAEPRAASQAK